MKKVKKKRRTLKERWDNSVVKLFFVAIGKITKL